MIEVVIIKSSSHYNNHNHNINNINNADIVLHKHMIYYSEECLGTQVIRPMETRVRQGEGGCGG